MRLWSLAAPFAAATVGAGVGAAVAAGGHVDYTAEAKVLVQATRGPSVVRPLLPNVRELATSSILAGNVDSTLRLPGSADALRQRLHASIAPQSQVIVLSIADTKRDRARQVAQESAVVLAQLVSTRFRTPPLKAVVLDPAHVVSMRGRHFLRDTLIGAAIGFVAASVALVAMRRGALVPAAPSDAKLAERERVLQDRIALVTQRERALAKRAGELATRERGLQQQDAAVPVEVQAARTVEPEPEPAPVAPPPGLQPVVRRGGGWNVNELERAVAARADAAPEAIEEWRTFLFLLREHAAADGSLPSSFDGLVDEVFAELVD